MASKFVARDAFPWLGSLPRSYFLGHHKSGLDRMKSMMSDVDLVIECRDYRIPLSSANPLLESALGLRKRLIVFTKRDLGHDKSNARSEHEQRLRHILAPSTALFTDFRRREDIKRVLAEARQCGQRTLSIAGARVMVVGMPNVGKSTLINVLRNHGVGSGKAVRTGDQPGVTRTIGSAVKILAGDDKTGQSNVYLVDTPGVFMPYVSDPYSMLKLALCGSVKDSVLPSSTVADYLLFHLNLVDPGLYAAFSAPTNDVFELLESIARKTGRLKSGGEPDVDSSALWLIQRWRNGHLGHFVLDDCGSIDQIRSAAASQAQSLDRPSYRQARVIERTTRGKSTVTT